MRLNRIKYQFKEFEYRPSAFKGLSTEEFRLFFKYLDDITPDGFRKASSFVIIASLNTRLGVIDCFVN